MSDKSYEQILAEAVGPDPRAPTKTSSETKAVVAIDRPTKSLEEALVAAITDAVHRVLAERGVS